MRIREAALVSLLLISCRGHAQQPPVVAKPNDPLLKHYEIRIQDLPRPFATRSAGNSPIVMRRPADGQLHVPPGFRVSLLTADVENPRNMVQTPNGDIFVAETAAGRITILRMATNGSLSARFVFAKDLNEPFGLAFRGDSLYVGDVDAVVRFPYRNGQTAAAGPPQRVVSLPDGGHSTRNVIFNRDGSKMFVAIGSASNVSPEDPPRAAVMEYNPDGSGARVFTWGLRNPVGLAWNRTTGTLWTSVNERDGLGDDLVPDFITSLRDSGFYGWPYAYLGSHADPRRHEHPELVSKAIVPDLLIQSHSAPLGLAFYEGSMFPPQYRGSALVALHGSWNRSKRTGYKVIAVPFRNGAPAGGYDDFVAGWSTDPDSRRVWGRPVGLLVLADGSLLISDDGANAIWRVTYSR
jgi:glucose/arabinose dehydrogenase